MDPSKVTVGRLKQHADMLSQAVQRLATAASYPPRWDAKHKGWRHPERDGFAPLFLATKLVGATSAANAMLVLAEQGYWFEAAILKRSIYEACLTLAYMLPPSGKQWPSERQSRALSSFFEETWDDPDRPFQSVRQRAQVPLKELKAPFGEFQVGNPDINPHDSGQSALQAMRHLSDYTHMAYPQIMELFDARCGYRLNGEQPPGASSGAVGAAQALHFLATMADTVAVLMAKITKSVVRVAQSRGSPPAGKTKLEAKARETAEAQGQLEKLVAVIEVDLGIEPGEQRRILRKFKGK